MENSNQLPVSIESLRSLNFGFLLKILSSVYLIKVDKHQYRYGNMYIIKHPVRKSLVLIDAVRPESKIALERFMKDGYTVDAVLLTHSDLIDQAYGDLKEVSTNLGNPAIYIHPKDVKPRWEDAQDIMTAPSAFSDYELEVFHFPGHTPGSSVIYSELNNGMVFSGDSAVGSNYEKEAYHFDRPPNNSDEVLRESWQKFNKEFSHFLPLHGKPEFTLSRKRKEEILDNLRKQEPTKSL